MCSKLQYKRERPLTLRYANCLLRHSLQCDELLSRKPPHCQCAELCGMLTSVTQSLTRVFRNLTFVTVAQTQLKRYFALKVKCPSLVTDCKQTDIVSSACMERATCVVVENPFNCS
jgi:hypothetical protein